MTQFIQVTPLGEIQGNGDIQEQFLGTLDIIDGCQLIPGVSGYAGTDSYFDFATQQVVAFPAKPSPNHIFNWQTKQWEDPRTLQDFKDAQWTQIKQARTAFIDAPLVTPYGTFDSDAAGRTSITDAVLLANNLSALSLPVAIEFTLADNSVVTLDAAQIVEVGLLLGQKVQHAHPHSQALRAQIEAATTKEEVEAVVW